MNTREKIHAFAEAREALSSGSWCVIASRFEFVTIEIVRWMKQIAEGRRICALVIDDANVMLASEARAALVAALRCVDLVTIAGLENWRDALPRNPALLVIYDEAADGERARKFRERIVQRKRGVVTSR